MAKKSAKKTTKKATEYKDVIVYEEEGWHLSYIDLKGIRREQRLDAESFQDAKHEASHLLDVPEENVGS